MLLFFCKNMPNPRSPAYDLHFFAAASRRFLSTTSLIVFRTADMRPSLLSARTRIKSGILDIYLDSNDLRRTPKSKLNCIHTFAQLDESGFFFVIFKVQLLKERVNQNSNYTFVQSNISFEHVPFHEFFNRRFL